MGSSLFALCCSGNIIKAKVFTACAHSYKLKSLPNIYHSFSTSGVLFGFGGGGFFPVCLGFYLSICWFVCSFSPWGAKFTLTGLCFHWLLVSVLYGELRITSHQIKTSQTPLQPVINWFWKQIFTRPFWFLGNWAAGRDLLPRPLVLSRALVGHWGLTWTDYWNFLLPNIHFPRIPLPSVANILLFTEKNLQGMCP